MTPFIRLLTRYLPKPIAFLIATGVYMLIITAIIILIGRSPNPMHYLDIG